MQLRSIISGFCRAGLNLRLQATVSSTAHVSHAPIVEGRIITPWERREKEREREGITWGRLERARVSKSCTTAPLSSYPDLDPPPWRMHTAYMFRHCKQSADLVIIVSRAPRLRNREGVSSACVVVARVVGAKVHWANAPSAHSWKPLWLITLDAPSGTRAVQYTRVSWSSVKRTVEKHSLQIYIESLKRIIPELTQSIYEWTSIFLLRKSFWKMHKCIVTFIYTLIYIVSYVS